MYACKSVCMHHNSAISLRAWIWCVLRDVLYRRIRSGLVISRQLGDLQPCRQGAQPRGVVILPTMTFSETRGDPVTGTAIRMSGQLSLRVKAHLL